MITDLPEVDIEIKGAKGWIAQGKDHQIVFFDVEPSGEEPEHSHDFPSWLLIVEGKMEVTVNGEIKIYEKGDDVFFPIHIKHSTKVLTKSRCIAFLSGKSLFKQKSVS
jgi:quercetin dioxygenase-like cupin family protein